MSPNFGPNGNGVAPNVAVAIGVLLPANGGTGVVNAGTLTNASNTTITGGGTLALAGFTLTAPATGTAALLGTAQSFTATNKFSKDAAYTTQTAPLKVGTSTTPTRVVELGYDSALGSYSAGAGYIQAADEGSSWCPLFINPNAVTAADGNVVIGSTTSLDTISMLQVNGHIKLNGMVRSAGRTRVAGDLTNATTTFSNMTGISHTLVSGRNYTGRLVIKCNDSTAADGIKLDFNGGTATTSQFWASATESAGGTTVLGTVISTSLAGVINYTTITGETVIEISYSLVCSGNGTFIPRLAQNAHSTGTLTVELGSFNWIEDTP